MNRMFLKFFLILIFVGSVSMRLAASDDQKSPHTRSTSTSPQSSVAKHLHDAQIAQLKSEPTPTALMRSVPSEPRLVEILSDEISSRVRSRSSSRDQTSSENTDQIKASNEEQSHKDPVEIFQKIMTSAVIVNESAQPTHTQPQSDSDSELFRLPDVGPTPLEKLQQQIRSNLADQQAREIRRKFELSQQQPNSEQKILAKNTKVAGHTTLTATALANISNGNWLTGALILGAQTAILFPEKVNKATDAVNNARKKINRENCDRGLQRCKAFTSWLTFGLYNPAPDRKQKKDK